MHDRVVVTLVGVLVDLEMAVHSLRAGRNYTGGAVSPETARDLTLRRFDSVEGSETVLEAERRCVACGLGAIPVRGDDGSVTAVLTRRALVQLRGEGVDLADLSAGEAGRPVVPVDARCSLEAALQALKEQEVGRLPVVENGRELGLITRADILGYRRIRQALGSQVRDLVLEVSPNDAMMMGSYSAYLAAGASALECVRRAQDESGKKLIESILDFGCGHGRVLRVLKAAFPEARLAACDIDRDGVRFCERTLGATPFLSREDPKDVRLEGEFDLIWCGSLLTHVDSDRGRSFLQLLESVLAPSGLLLFTVLGPTAAALLREGQLIGSPVEGGRVQVILQGYEQTGFGYSDYEGHTGQGLSLCSPAWVERLIETEGRLRLLRYDEAGWDGLQDVATCMHS